MKFSKILLLVCKMYEVYKQTVSKILVLVYMWDLYVWSLQTHGQQIIMISI